jgi:FkbM family methyltransferase
MPAELTRISGARARAVFALTQLLSWPALFPLFRVVQKLCFHAMNRTSAGFLPVTHTGERHVAQRVLRRVPSGYQAVIIDCGANYGSYSSMILDECRAARVSATLHLFEPSTQCHAELLTRFASDSVSVRIHHAAVSNTSGRAPIFFAWPGAGGTSLSSGTSRIQGTSSLGQHSEDVTTVALDDFCEREGITAIDLLKLDIEGAELQALAGAEKLIGRGAIAAIQFELGAAALPVGVNLYQFWVHYSERFDFHLVLTHGLTRIDDYAPDLECFYAASTFLMLRKSN